MATRTPDTWNAFCRKIGINANPCPPTSLYPEFPGSVAQQLSDGVAEFVAATYNNGAITYVEYGYAKQRGFPVASVLNAAGYYAQPTPESVSIALTKARINPDGTQVLLDVYTNPDPRTYPVSSYSYMIVPTTTAKPFSAEKGDILGKFILYFVCAGQQKAAALGYSPLPKNLVEVAFAAEQKIPGAPAPPPIDQCNNPTINGSFSPDKAPLPPATTKKGATTGGATQTAAGNTAGATNGDATVVATDASATTGDGTTGAVDGQLVAASGPVRMPKDDGTGSLPWYALVVALFLGVVFAPPVVALRLRQRDQAS
jgi:phosphate transport system substrate-binding protein